MWTLVYFMLLNGYPVTGNIKFENKKACMNAAQEMVDLANKKGLANFTLNTLCVPNQ